MIQHALVYCVPFMVRIKWYFITAWEIYKVLLTNIDLCVHLFSFAQRNTS
jgi:hypothetical protein